MMLRMKLDGAGASLRSVFMRKRVPTDALACDRFGNRSARLGTGSNHGLISGRFYLTQPARAGGLRLAASGWRARRFVTTVTGRKSTCEPRAADFMIGSP